MQPMSDQKDADNERPSAARFYFVIWNPLLKLHDECELLSLSPASLEDSQKVEEAGEEDPILVGTKDEATMRYCDI